MISRRRWPIPRLLAAGEPGAQELLRRFRVDPPGIVREVAGRRLSRLVQEWVPAMAPDLAPFVTRELGAVAQRRAALTELDRLAGETGIQPLVFKGAANALSCYSSEGLRSSQDLDILLTAADIEALYPGELAPALLQARPIDHLPRKHIAGFATEVHYRLGDHAKWGEPADLFADSAALANFAHLRQPAPHSALTIALLHTYKHYGRMPFDPIDVAMLHASGTIDWPAAVDLWTRCDLLPQVLPGLLAFLRTSQNPPAVDEAALVAQLPHEERPWLELFASHLLDQRFSFIREQRLRCHRHGRGFIPFCIGELFGQHETTTSMTGRPPSDPRHTFHHYIALPLRRLLRVLRPR
jgi:hypothetical protein